MSKNLRSILNSLWITLAAILANNSFAQWSAPLAVDGPSIRVLDKFAQATYFAQFYGNSFYASNLVVWENYIAGMRLQSSSPEAEHFIAENFFVPGSEDTGGYLHRYLQLSIPARVPGQSYRIVASQNFDLKNTDRSNVRDIRSGLSIHTASVDMILRCNETELGQERLGLTRSLYQDANPWITPNLQSHWFNGANVSKVYDIPPDMCPSNKFVIETRFRGAQDLVIRGFEIMLLNVY